MNSKVLMLGLPSEGMRRDFAGEFLVCSSPAEVLTRIGNLEARVVLCSLPEEGATLHFLFELDTVHPKIPVVVISRDGWTPESCATQRAGPLLILPESINPGLLLSNIRRFIQAQESRREQKELFESSVSGSVSALFEVLSIADPYSASLGQRLRYAMDLFCKAGQIALNWELETGALLAEIGVLTIPVRVMLKHHSGQDLSTFEKEMILRVPERGADLLRQIPALRQVAEIIRYQSKNFDGTGWPEDSLSGQRLPPGARILKIVNDLFRLKENGRSQEEAMNELESRAGRYDPHFLQVARESFDLCLPAKISGDTLPMTVKDLRPGQLLASNIETDDGVLLIRDGQLISPKLLHKLRNFAFTSGIREPIYVIDLLESGKLTATFQSLAHSETSFHFKSN
ncbi:MAG TPA: HD domain-containing phosphohydrolase [Verrucomicrobiae bacterium]|nr:HD domain-containing phosphohydrolase [Verrucomicrobiae bacterium]